jgi:hypothetical protein
MMPDLWRLEFGAGMSALQFGFGIRQRGTGEVFGISAGFIVARLKHRMDRYVDDNWETNKNRIYLPGTGNFEGQYFKVLVSKEDGGGTKLWLFMIKKEEFSSAVEKKRK